MRVLYINTVYGQGSTGRIVADLGKMLEENGHEFKAAYGRGDNSNDPHCYRIGNNLDMYIHAGLSRITDRAGFYSKRATRKLVEFIKEYNPDIIHLHNLHGYYLNIEILFKFLADEYKGRVIWTLHDCWAFTGHCVHYTYAKCSKWKYGCSKCKEKKRYPISFIMDNSEKNYLRKKELFTSISNLILITPSKWLQEQVSQSFLKQYNCFVVNNGIDNSLFIPKVKEKKKNICVLLNVADGLDVRKGHEDLIKLRKILDSKHKMIVVGLKKKEIKKFPEGITAIEKTQNIDELVRYYQESDYLLNLTYEDTFPTVNLEALACGLPVITYESGGSSEMINSKCGYIVPQGRIEEVYRIVERKSTIKREDCRKHSFKYNKEDKYMEYIHLYENIMENTL